MKGSARCIVNIVKVVQYWLVVISFNVVRIGSDWILLRHTIQVCHKRLVPHSFFRNKSDCLTPKKSAPAPVDLGNTQCGKMFSMLPESKLKSMSVIRQCNI